MSFYSCTGYIQIYRSYHSKHVFCVLENAARNCRIANSAIEGELHQITPNSVLKEYLEELFPTN